MLGAGARVIPANPLARAVGPFAADCGHIANSGALSAHRAAGCSRFGPVDTPRRLIQIGDGEIREFDPMQASHDIRPPLRIVRGLFFSAAMMGLVACAQTPEQIAAAQHAQCAELGYSAGTDQYGQCRLTLMALEQQKHAATMATLAAAQANAQNMHLGLMAIRAQQTAPGTVENPLYVRPCRQGGLVYC